MTKLCVCFPNLDYPESKIFQQFLFSTIETFRSQILKLDSLTEKKQSCFIKQSKKTSNDQEPTQSDPTSYPQNKREITKYIN